MQNENLKEKTVSDVKEVVSDSKEWAKAASAEVGNKTQEVGRKFSSNLDDAKEKISDFGADLKEKAAATVGETDRVIRKNPYPSLGLAFSAGLILGVLLNRR